MSQGGREGNLSKNHQRFPQNFGNMKLDQGHRKDFLIGGAQSESTHRVVNNLYYLGGHMPPVPTPMMIANSIVMNK